MKLPIFALTGDLAQLVSKLGGSIVATADPGADPDGQGGGQGDPRAALCSVHGQEQGHAE